MRVSPSPYGWRHDDVLNERELTSLRSIAVQSLPNTATVSRKELVSDGSLGHTEQLIPIAMHVPCRIDEDSDGRTRVVGGQVASTGELFLRLAYGTPVKEGDQIGVTVNRNTRTFDVGRVVEASYATVVTVRVTEVR